MANNVISTGEKATKQVLGKRPSKMKRIITLAVLVVLGVLILGTATIVVGSYTKHWSSSVIQTASRVVPYPAVIVNGHWTSYHDYLENVKTLNYSYSQPEVLQASGLSSKPSEKDVEAMVLDRMVKDEIVRQLAAKNGITVNQATIDAELKKLVDQTGSTADVENRIRQFYGWDLKTFGKEVLGPYLLRQRLQEKIAMDDAINAEQKQRAEALLVRVQSGKEDFQTIAKEVNEDVTKSTGGDLGIFGKGERDPAIEDAAFSLKADETSGIVRTVEGFHLLKLLEKIPADEKAGTGEKVHIAHLFIAAKQLDSWLFDQSKDQRISILLRGYSWDRASARVQ